MTTKHTKGPWSVSQTGKYVRLCIPGTVLNICKMEINGDEEANARLIAAAPELLEALKALCSELHQGRKFNVRNSDDFRLLTADAYARTVIAMATAL